MEQKHNAEGVESFLQAMDMLRELYTLTMDQMTTCNVKGSCVE